MRKPDKVNLTRGFFMWIMKIPITVTIWATKNEVKATAKFEIILDTSGKEDKFAVLYETDSVMPYVELTNKCVELKRKWIEKKHEFIEEAYKAYEEV